MKYILSIEIPHTLVNTVNYRIYKRPGLYKLVIGYVALHDQYVAIKDVNKGTELHHSSRTFVLNNKTFIKCFQRVATVLR